MRTYAIAAALMLAGAVGAGAGAAAQDYQAEPNDQAPVPWKDLGGFRTEAAAAKAARAAKIPDGRFVVVTVGGTPMKLDAAGDPVFARSPQRKRSGVIQRPPQPPSRTVEEPHR